MKKLLLGALLTACLTQYSQAQIKDMPWQVCIGFVILEYSVV